MSTIRKAGIVIKPHAPRIESALSDLGDYFDRRGVKYILEEAAAEKLGRPDGIPRARVPEESGLVVVLGGDGTLLSIAHLAARRGVPVMGVNLGSLGFLTEVTLPEMTLTLDALLDGAPGIFSTRLLLEALFKGESNLCLNDVVINKGAVARMIHMKVRLDHKELDTMKADGLIVATPTGSTAYSLAAGGPILHPAVPAVLLTPICPHTLTFRPIVISSEIPVRIELLTSGEEVYLTFDGQRGRTMVKGDFVEVRRAKQALKLVSSPKRNYFGLLSEKFSWGG